MLPNEAPQAPERFDVMGALIYFCGDLQNEKQTVKACNELELCGFEHPFKVLENGFPGIYKGHWLQFLRDARKYKTEIRRLTVAIAFARKEWRYSDKFAKAQSKFYGWRTSNSSSIAINSIPSNRITDEAGQAVL